MDCAVVRSANLTLRLWAARRRSWLGDAVVISISGLLGQAFAILLALVLAPLLSGWVGQCRAWLQSRTAPPLLLPYYQLQKLFHKDVVLAHGAIVAVAIPKWLSHPSTAFASVTSR